MQERVLSGLAIVMHCQTRGAVRGVSATRFSRASVGFKDVGVDIAEFPLQEVKIGTAGA